MAWRRVLSLDSGNALRMRRRFLAPRAALAGVLTLGVPLLVWCQQPAHPPAKTFLAIRQNELSDSALSRLAKVLAQEVPRDQWARVAVLPGEGLEAVVDRVYNVYAPSSLWNIRTDSTRYLPITMRALKQLIDSTNQVGSRPLAVGEQLFVPPFPVRKGFAGMNTAVRFYDPNLQKAVLFEHDPSDRYVEARYSWHGFESSQEVAGFSAVTAIALSASAARLLRDLGSVVEFPRVAVDLHGAGLVDPVDALRTSPYLALAKARLQSKLSDMKLRARGRPLVVVDWNFGNGHGKDVRKVISSLLAELNLGDLDRHVEVIDLLASRGADLPPWIQNLTWEYRSYLVERRLASAEEAGAGTGDALVAWMEARDWSEDRQVRSVAVSLLKSVLYSQLRRGAFLSLSWSVRHPEHHVLPAAYSSLLDKGSFIVASAGNDRLSPLEGESSPQAEAAKSPRFVNVTTSDKMHTIRGTVSGNAPVDVSLMSLEETEFARTSFSSPVVAVSAWLRHLADGTPPDSLRVLLSNASSLTIDPAKVRSGGAFDPARLLAALGPHLLTPSGEIKSIASPVISIGDCLRQEGLHQVTFVDSADVTFVLARSSDRVPPFYRVHEKCRAGAVDASWTEDGQRVQVTTLADLRRRAAMVSLRPSS